MNHQKQQVIFGLGIIGVFTFQLPFYLFLLPQLQTALRLIPGTSFLEIESNNGTIFFLTCDDYSSTLFALPKCFDPTFNSYGYCTGESRAEFYKVFGRLESNVESNVEEVIPESIWMNPFSESRNPPLVTSAAKWCSSPTRFYDPKGTSSVFGLTSRMGALDHTAWLMTFLIGGLTGVFIVSSIYMEVLVVYFALYGLVWGITRVWFKVANLKNTNLEEKEKLMKPDETTENK